jgi:TPR repeat protein
MEKARVWYAKAAEQGNVPAQANLGVMYLKGDGIAPDINQAIHLLSQVLPTPNQHTHTFPPSGSG